MNKLLRETDAQLSQVQPGLSSGVYTRIVGGGAI